MADQEQLEVLRQGAPAWNAWRKAHPTIRPDLREADLREPDLSDTHLGSADLTDADLRGAKLPRANLNESDLRGANLRGADLRRADLDHADLREAILSGADLRGATLQAADLRKAHLRGTALCRAFLRDVDLRKADLSGADLSTTKLIDANLSGATLDGADLQRADLRGATLVEADFTNADLTDCRVYGVSAWKLRLSEKTKQQNLIITHYDDPEITVDNIEIAQFVYLLLDNEKIRDVIDTITSKAVLVLGRFTPERKAVLDALRDELRRRGYLPIVFDFDKPTSQSTDETVTLLARMARFVIADISDAKSVLQELRAIVPDMPSLAVQPIIVAAQGEPGMFDFIRRYPWVLEPRSYDAQDELIRNLGEWVIRPAEAKVRELRGPGSA